MERTETPRRKRRHRAGKNWRASNRKWREERLRLAKLAAAQAQAEPLPIETPPPAESSPDRVGEGIETALFERQSEAVPDVAMVRQAKRERWGTSKPVQEIVIQKALTLAAGLPWTTPTGEIRQEEWTPPQVLGAAKLALDVERQNQTEEHHGDRMGYAERALQMRAKVGDYRPANVAAIGVETDGAARVSIYLPARDDDAEIPVLLDADRVEGAP
jgi:hypothetical protein